MAVLSHLFLNVEISLNSVDEHLGVDSDFMSRATPTIRIVYKQWGDRVAEELRKALENRDKVAEFWRRKRQEVETDGSCASCQRPRRRLGICI
jgi:hypothetical protein